MQEEVGNDTVQLNAIPPEVVLETIFPYLHPIELWQCRRVCRTWHVWIKVYFRTLRILNFSDPISEYYLTPDGLYSITQSLKFLRAIRLDNCQHSVTEKTLTCLAKRCHRLEVLCVPRCREVTDDVLRAIAGNCPRLRELNISRCFQISDVGLKFLAKNCKQLTELSVNRCFGVTDKGLTALLQGCPLLREIDIGWCYQVSGKSLGLIPLHCAHLKSIRIKGCSSVMDETVHALYTAGISVNNFF